MSLLQLVRFSIRTGQLGQVMRSKPARVQRLQQRRLAELLQVAVTRSAFYSRKYHGIDIKQTPFQQLPTVTKQELMEHFDEVVTDPFVKRDEIQEFISKSRNLGRWFHGRYGVSHTSGSQGEPLLIVQDRHCLETLFAVMSCRANSAGRPGIIEGLRRLRSPRRIAVVTTGRGFFPSGAAMEFMPQIVGPFVNLARFSSEQPDLIERLNDFQPHVLIAYASVLSSLTWQMDRLRLRELRQVSNSSEQLTAEERIRIQNALGVPVLDHYGMGECLLLSDACHTDEGMHVNADWAILEVVDKQNRPVPDGQLGDKVLVTNLANHVQPFIRYEVEDRVAMATSKCRCGSNLPRIQKIEGRVADVFWVDSGGGPRMLGGALFHAAMDSLAIASEWQAVQVERNYIEIRFVARNEQVHPGPRLNERLRGKLLELGLPWETVVEAKATDAILRDLKSGKLRRMVSHVPPPHVQQAG